MVDEVLHPGKVGIAFGRHAVLPAHVVVAARNEEKASAVARAIVAEGGKAEALRLDVADPVSVSAAFFEPLPDAELRGWES